MREGERKGVAREPPLVCSHHDATRDGSTARELSWVSILCDHDPGAYIMLRYYVKRTTDQEGDVRLALLPCDFFAGKRVLDVGCNEGWVTCEIGACSSQHWNSPAVER